jgi:lysozyme family protein
MDSNFKKCFDIYLKNEGGFSNNPNDPGGATNMGVTLGLLQKLGYDTNGDGHVNISDVVNLTRQDVEKIIRLEIWNAVKGDVLPLGVDLAVFDGAAMSGPAQAAKWLQRAVSYSSTEIIVDGIIGPKTLAAVAKADAIYLVNSICAQRQNFCAALSSAKYFLNGWTRRISFVKDTAINMARVGKP